ncbi:MAG: hypothetical protein ACREEM_39725 [Blastocatellia bacterium]
MENGKITFEQASLIAEREVERILNTSDHLQQYKFDPVMFSRETEHVWTFAAGSEELIELGYVPGAIHVSIDKVDGHIWSREEMESYALQQERARFGAQAVV